MAAASLNKSNISFRRQGSSGIVWGAGSIPGDDAFSANDSKHAKSSSSEAPVLFRSRSTGFFGPSKPQTAYVHGKASGDKSSSHHASHKSRFNLGRWIKKVLSKTTQ